MELTLFLSRDDVLEKEDGDTVVIWEVSICIDGEEMVDLLLGFELGREGRRRDVHV